MASSSPLYCWDNCLQNRDGEGAMIECDECGNWVHKKCHLGFFGISRMGAGWERKHFIGVCCQSKQDRCPGGDDCPGAGKCKATHHWCSRNGHWVPTGKMLIKRGTGNAYAMECEACRDARDGSIKAYNAKPDVTAALKLRNALPEVKAAKKLRDGLPEVKAARKLRDGLPEVKAARKLRNHAATEANSIARLRLNQDSAHLKLSLSAKEQWDEARGIAAELLAELRGLEQKELIYYSGITSVYDFDFGSLVKPGGQLYNASLDLKNVQLSIS